MIEFLLHMHATHTSVETMQKMERWISEHRQVRSVLIAVQRASPLLFNMADM